MFVHAALLKVTFWSHGFSSCTSTAGHEGSSHPGGPGLGMGKPLDYFLHGKTLAVSWLCVEKEPSSNTARRLSCKQCSDMKPSHVRNSWLASSELSAPISSPQRGTELPWWFYQLLCAAPLCLHQCWHQLHYAFLFSCWPKREQKSPKAFYFYLVVQSFMMPKELFIEHIIFSSAVQGAT